MLYHYTDRVSAAEILRDGVIKAHPVVVYPHLLGGEPIVLDKAVWLTTSPVASATVAVKLHLAGWPVDEPGAVWRLAVDDETLPDLVDWAFARDYDPALFRWMVRTAKLVGEYWIDWRLASADVPCVEGAPAFPS